MITVENTYVIKKPMDEIWAFFNNIADLASCVPTTKSFTIIDDDNVDLILRIVLGAIPLENRVSMSIIERRAPRHLVARGVSYSGDAFKKITSVEKDAASEITINLDLEPLNNGETRIIYSMKVEAFGSVKRIYEAILKGQRKKLEQLFLENIRKRTKADIREEVPVPR